MPCVLRVYGAEFDVERFLRESGLRAYRVSRKGHRFLNLQPVSEVSGFDLEVSAADFRHLEHQITDAVTFLQEQNRALALLSSFGGIEEATLDFTGGHGGMWTGGDGGHLPEDHFPPRLLLLMGQFGLGLRVLRPMMAAGSVLDG